MKNLKYFLGLMILCLTPYPTFGQNMKKEYSERTSFQATMSETDDSYKYSCVFDINYFEQIEKVIKIHFKEFELENTSFKYRIQLNKDNLIINFKSKELKKNRAVQAVIEKFKKIEKEISAITM